MRGCASSSAAPARCSSPAARSLLPSSQPTTTLAHGWSSPLRFTSSLGSPSAQSWPAAGQGISREDSAAQPGASAGSLPPAPKFTALPGRRGSPWIGPRSPLAVSVIIFSTWSAVISLTLNFQNLQREIQTRRATVRRGIKAENTMASPSSTITRLLFSLHVQPCGSYS